MLVLYYFWLLVTLYHLCVEEFSLLKVILFALLVGFSIINKLNKESNLLPKPSKWFKVVFYLSGLCTIFVLADNYSIATAALVISIILNFELRTKDN